MQIVEIFLFHQLEKTLPKTFKNQALKKNLALFKTKIKLFP